MRTVIRWEPVRSWDPFREARELEARLNSAFGLATAARREGEVTKRDWAPLVDIVEDEKEYVIKAELPEVKKEEVKVTVENGVLSIRGERQCEKEEKDRKYRRIERAYGSFVRSFALPDDADAGKVAAEFQDGILKVRLPKTEAARPKTIEVKWS